MPPTHVGANGYSKLDDHDLLITLNTQFESFLEAQKEEKAVREAMLSRIAALEKGHDAAAHLFDEIVAKLNKGLDESERVRVRTWIRQEDDTIEAEKTRDGQSPIVRSTIAGAIIGVFGILVVALLQAHGVL